jgi:hypothetical protein
VEDLERSRWLRPFAHRLGDRALWRARGEPLARGVAVGMFWAFVVPFAQVLFAAAHCVWWRANIPAAAAATFITNPLTVGGWLVLAHHVGSLVVGPGESPSGVAGADGLWATIQALGLPTVVGMGIFAIGGALAGYVLVRLGSRLWLHLRRARRARRRSA